MADYSHLSALKVQPETIVRHCALGTRPTDEMFLEALDQIDPPLLSGLEDQVLRSALKPRRGRRPNDAPPLELVARQIEMLNRPDLPKGFLQLLAERLQSGERYTDLDRGLQLLRLNEKRDRTSFVWFVYDEIYKQLDGVSSCIEHEAFGWVEVPRGKMSRSKRALKMTGDVLRAMGRHPPTEATMLNIITQNKSARNS